MNLGAKVFFIDKDGCNAIRKGTITCVSHFEAYVDFLSSKFKRTHTGIRYTVCANKNGNYIFFKPEKVFESIESIKSYLAEIEIEKFDIFE